MRYDIVFHPEAAKEVAGLDNNVRLLVLKQIKKLAVRPGLGQKLGNRFGYDLSGYRKLYLDRKRIRIVYRIVEEKILVQIIAVGKREGMSVYKEAARRTRS